MRKRIFKFAHPGLPPTVNHLYRSKPDGRRYMTAQAAEYHADTAASMSIEYRGKAPFAGNVYLKLTFLTNNLRKWDIDNRVKAVQDCLAPAGIILDDRQITELHVKRVQSEINATVIELWEGDNHYGKKQSV